MNTVAALLILVALGLLVFYRLASTALQHRCNLRAALRLGPGSLLLEVKEHDPEKPPIVAK